MKIRNSIKNLVKAGALAGFMAFMSANCQKESGPEYNPTKISNVQEIQSLKNLESPSGLSSNYMYGSKKSKNLRSSFQEGDLKVFTQGPLFDDIDFANSTNPVICQISESLQLSDLTINPLVELDLSQYKSFFWGMRIGAGGNTSKPAGLTLENLVLEDGSILFSSNLSETILEISPSKDIKTYLEGDFQLRGITSMFKSIDGKIYCAQAPLVIDSSIAGPVSRGKRVISIDNSKNIKTEFELPSENSRQRGWNAYYFEQLKIIENSQAGKNDFGTKFYVSDLLEDVIYKVDGNMNVTVLARGLRYPTSIIVDEAGDLFYTTSPLWFETGPSDIEYPTELRNLNPKTGESTTIYKFDERNIAEYTSSGSGYYVMYNGDKYVLPVGFNVTAILSETASDIDFLFTNSHQGTLRRVTATKQNP